MVGSDTTRTKQEKSSECVLNFQITLPLEIRVSWETLIEISNKCALSIEHNQQIEDIILNCKCVSNKEE